jgi:ketosteroid isomerase-like protein
MSRGNLDLVRSIYADWERGDYFGSGDWVDPDIEFVMVDGPTPTRLQGRDRMVAFWRDILTSWDELRAEAEEYRELDDERVIVLSRNTGRGRASGLELAQMQTRGANVFQVRGGKVIRLALYWDRDRALADLGLAE